MRTAGVLILLVVAIGLAAAARVDLSAYHTGEEILHALRKLQPSCPNLEIRFVPDAFVRGTFLFIFAQWISIRLPHGHSTVQF